MSLPFRSEEELLRMTIPQITTELNDHGISLSELRLKKDYIQRHLDNQLLQLIDDCQFS